MFWKQILALVIFQKLLEIREASPRDPFQTFGLASYLAEVSETAKQLFAFKFTMSNFANNNNAGLQYHVSIALRISNV